MTAVAGKVSNGSQNSLQFWVLGAFAGVLAMHTWLVFTRAINWDEFFYYSQIEQFLRGELNTPLQVLHVHLFGWLPSLSGTGVDKIVIARLFMLGCELVTAIAIVCIAQRFTSRIPSLLAALAYLSAGFVVENGYSFRTDPLAIAFASSAMCVLLRARLTTFWIALFGLLVALAGLTTMKTVLLLPAFAGIAWLRWSESGWSIASAIKLIAAATAAAVLFGLLLLAHMAMMPEQVTQAAQANEAQSMVSASSRKMFFIGMPPYLAYFKIFTATALPLMVAVIAVPFVLLRSARLSAEKWALLGLFLPITTLAFYHNALPYYYAFMMPPVAAAAAIAFARILERYDARLLLAIMVINAGAMTAASGPSLIDRQRSIQIAASEIFPEPVHYFDFPAMLPAFKKANVFMTRWGMDGYIAGGGNSYEQILEHKTVPLLLANDPIFNPSFLELLDDRNNDRFFRPDDAVILRSTYRQFWGPFWLAGKDVAAGTSTDWKVHVPGTYTITGSPMRIDGQMFEIGETVELDRQTYTLQNDSGAAASLIWGDNLQVPESPPPPRPIWTDF